MDTANNYQFQESEKWIGEWLEKRGVRDEMGKTYSMTGLILVGHFKMTPNKLSVLATKYTTNYRGGPNQPQIMANFTGNGSKSMHMSVNASLKKLKTDYIDLVGFLEHRGYASGGVIC